MRHCRRWQRKNSRYISDYREQHRDEPGPARTFPTYGAANGRWLVTLIEKMRESSDIHSHHGCTAGSWASEEQAISKKPEPLFGDEPWWSA